MSTENAPAAADPSMEDILASIRRILNEEEATPAEPPGVSHVEGSPEAAAADILDLDASMMVSGPVAQAAPPHQPALPAAVDEPAPNPAPSLPFVQTVPVPMPDLVMPPHDASAHDVSPLVAPAAAAAAAGSVSTLLQTLAQERGTAVSRGGPTIEDLVREEMRPLLKDWLDTHLPPLVERLVRAEIERVVNRTG